MSLLRILTAFFGLFGRGRSPACLLNIPVPHSGYRVERAIPYGENPRHRLDVYMPLAAAAPAPVVLFFYGGGFVAGRKEEYRFIGQALAGKGIVTVIADYRLHPEARFPDFLRDGARALAVSRSLAARCGGDPRNLFLAGHSAGAYIAVMLAADPRYVRNAGGDPSWIRGVIGMAGLYEVSPAQAGRMAVFGGAGADRQPAAMIDGLRPPMLLVTGARDSRATRAAANHVAQKLRAAGSSVAEKIYETGHMGLMLAFVPGFRKRVPLRDDVAAFVKAPGKF